MGKDIFEVDGVITGSLSRMDEPLVGSLSPVDDVISGNVTMQLAPNPYTGDYDVIPKIQPQILPTADKTMKSDVTVWGIPAVEVSNLHGTTFIVGDD